MQILRALLLGSVLAGVLAGAALLMRGAEQAPSHSDRSEGASGRRF